MAKARRSTLIRFWLAQHQGGIGVALGALILLILAAVALPRMGPNVELEGRVTGFGVGETEEGTYPVAHIQVADRQITVRLSGGHGCNLGDRIRVGQGRRVWGPSYGVGTRPCAVREASADAQAR
ncbi:MAG: hypothetical protein V4597_00855 [Pseudomonadota bacterium]